MRKVTLVLMAVIQMALAGCASMDSRWKDVMPGQGKDDVVDSLGNPSGIMLNHQGNYVYLWRVDGLTCGVILNNDEKVKEKKCIAPSPESQQAQAYRSAAAAQMWASMHQAPIFQPTQYHSQAYQMQTIPTSNCTTNAVGGQTYTNCSGSGQGIDTSMYRQ